MCIMPRVYLPCFHLSLTSCGCFTSPRQAWTEPAQCRTRRRSVQRVWPASVLQRCAAGLSQAQPALSIISKIRLQMSSSQENDTKTNNRLYTLQPTHKQKWYITLFGLLKVFSSITLLDVRTVAFDPSALMLAWSPVVEIVRLTVSDPKFTICKGAFNINTRIYVLLPILHRNVTCLYSQEAIPGILPGDSRCCQRTRVAGTDCSWMNHGTTRFAEKLLHPVTGSSVLLPGVEDNSIWIPPDCLIWKWLLWH